MSLGGVFGCLVWLGYPSLSERNVNTKVNVFVYCIHDQHERSVANVPDDDLMSMKWLSCRKNLTYTKLALPYIGKLTACVFGTADTISSWTLHVIRDRDIRSNNVALCEAYLAQNTSISILATS